MQSAVLSRLNRSSDTVTKLIRELHQTVEDLESGGSTADLVAITRDAVRFLENGVQFLTTARLMVARGDGPKDDVQQAKTVLARPRRS